MVCSNCGESGHNKRTCEAQTSPHKDVAPVTETTTKDTATVSTKGSSKRYIQKYQVRVYSDGSMLNPAIFGYSKLENMTKGPRSLARRISKMPLLMDDLTHALKSVKKGQPASLADIETQAAKSGEQQFNVGKYVIEVVTV